MSTHQLRKLLTNTAQQPQPVILRKRRQEVLHDVALISGAHDLLQLRDNGLLVRDRQRRGGEDADEFRVGLEGRAEAVQGLGGSVEGGGFRGGGVLCPFVN